MPSRAQARHWRATPDLASGIGRGEQLEGVVLGRRPAGDREEVSAGGRKRGFGSVPSSSRRGWRPRRGAPDEGRRAAVELRLAGAWEEDGHGDVLPRPASAPTSSAGACQRPKTKSDLVRRIGLGREQAVVGTVEALTPGKKLVEDSC